MPASALIKSPLGSSSQEVKLPRSPLDAPPLSLVSSTNSNGGNILNQSEDKDRENKLDMSSSGEGKPKSKMADMSDGSDLEDVNTTSGTDLDTTTGTASGDGSDLDSDGESERERSGKRRKPSGIMSQDSLQLEDTNSALISAVSSSGNLSIDRPFLSASTQHSFFPPPDEQALPPTTTNANAATTDSIKAIASIAEKYFGPGLIGLHQEKKMGPLPYHSMFPFQFLPNFHNSLYPFSTDRGALNPGLFFKAEPKSPREQLHKMVSGAQGNPAPSGESPFDLSTKTKETKLAPPTPTHPSNPNSNTGSGSLPSAVSSGEEQPLDLSISSRSRGGHNGVAAEPQNHKNHIYGVGKGVSIKDEILGFPQPHSQSLHQSPLTQHQQHQSQPHQPPPLHYAKPSAFFMDPIYRYFRPD